jgi:hypothetical protein
MSFREKERDYAKLHIAHQIAMNRKCAVDYGYVEINGTPGDDRAVYDSNFAYDDTGIGEILGGIVIIAEYRLPEGTVLAARDGAGFTGPGVPDSGDERPRWVRAPPEIPGYYTGAGVSDRHTELYKNILAADVEAAQAIAKEKNSYIRSFSYDGVTENGTEQASGTVLLSWAELYGLFILGRWVGPDGACYSLAAARRD